MSKMLHQAVVGLENNDQEDSREKHPMIIIDDGQMLIMFNFAFGWCICMRHKMV